jgi:hypothetical protein
MIITKAGTPQIPDKWWIDELAICDICGAQGTLQRTDPVRLYHGRASLKCPTEHCKGYMRSKRPSIRTLTEIPGVTEPGEIISPPSEERP